MIILRLYIDFVRYYCIDFEIDLFFFYSSGNQGDRPSLSFSTIVSTYHGKTGKPHLPRR